MDCQTSASSRRSRSNSPFLEPYCDDFLPANAPDPAKLYPWVTAKSTQSEDPMVQMHEEMMDFYDFVQPSQGEVKAHNEVLERIEKVVKRLWPGTQIKSFGSLKTGLWLPNSDMDLAVFTPNRLLSTKYLIKELALELNFRKILCYQERVFRARVPILKLRDQKTAIPVDICFNIENGVTGVDMVKAYMDRYPEAKYITIVLKYFLRQRALNETYSGGIGSFLLFCTVIAGLQEHRRRFPQGGKFTLAHYFLHYLHFYGYELDISETGLRIAGTGAVFPKPPNSPALLTLICPQDDEHDIGQNSFHFEKVQEAFAAAYEVMMVQPFRKSGLTPLSCIIRADRSMLERR